jgi:23S rRNA pseudouridine1911/1915/1917 synthase
VRRRTTSRNSASRATESTATSHRLDVTADRGDVGIRLDLVVLRHLSNVPGLSRNRIQRLIDVGHVTVNGRQVRRASSRIAADDVITIELPSRKPRQPPAAEALPLDIRYEDHELLIVNKPPGQVSHPAFRHSSGTLLNAILGYARGAWVPSLVSRLDKGTSGLVLVAKGAAIQAALQRLSNANAIEKDYLAVVRGKPPARGTIDLALDRDPWDERRVTVRDRGGVPSVTRFERIRAAAIGPDTFLSVVRCRLVTGRMHQIRVHLAARGWPIVGDSTYGVKFTGMERQALHAWRIAFTHPTAGTRVEATAPPPEDMLALLDRFDMREIR